MHKPARSLEIVDPEADRHFHELARSLSLNPADTWLGGYVDYEWNHGRHLFEVGLVSVDGRQVLEFGCNVGATAIVLAHLGAVVKAIDVNANYIALAELNAARYGVAGRIEFSVAPDTTKLPFDSGSFDVVSCNSVLEYVPRAMLGPVQLEIDRVTKAGGFILIAGTSNRMWPRETHSGRWLINYLPEAVDQTMLGRCLQRGAWPWVVRAGFGSYDDVLLDNDKAFLDAKARIGTSAWKLRLLSLFARLTRQAGISAGMLLPSMQLVLRKRQTGV